MLKLIKHPAPIEYRNALNNVIKLCPHGSYHWLPDEVLVDQIMMVVHDSGKVGYIYKKHGWWYAVGWSQLAFRLLPGAHRQRDVAASSLF